MQAARNIVIIALAALVVAAAPGGGNAASTVLTALSLGFLAAMGFLGYRFYGANQMTISTLSDARRGILYGALGVIGVLIAGADEFFATDGGTLAWIALLALSALAILRIWTDANAYS